MRVCLLRSDAMLMVQLDLLCCPAGLFGSVSWYLTACQRWQIGSFPCRLKSGKACYHSVQNLLSSSLLSKNLKIKIYRTIILPVDLYGCETWLLTLREERRLRVFEKRVLRGIFGPKRDGVTGEWRKLHNEELNDLSRHTIFCG